MLDDELFDRLTKLMPTSTKKQFHYILTAGLHSPYKNETITNDHQKLFTKKITENAKKYYVRQLETSKSLTKFLDDILKKDPKAKIFITTDHAPPLQNVYQGVSMEQKYLVRYTTINFDLELPDKVASYELGATLKTAFGFQNRYESILQLQRSKNIILRPLDADFLTYVRDTGEKANNNEEHMKQLDILFRYYWKGER